MSSAKHESGQFPIFTFLSIFLSRYIQIAFYFFSSIISYFFTASGLLFLRVSAKTNKKEEESFVIRFFLCRSSIQFQLKEVSERFRDKDIPFYQV